MKGFLIVGGSLGALLLVAILYWFFPLGGCYRVWNVISQEGSQGYRIWTGSTLKSFDHANKRICVPRGWKALDAVALGKGWAEFEQGHTGVLIKENAFGTKDVQLENSSYTLEVLYPLTEEKRLSEYITIIENAYERVGKLFNDTSANEIIPHTVLITVGLAGDTRSNNTQVYPDPSERLTLFMRSPDQTRAEELLIHAVMHLYNRFSNRNLDHQKIQNPLAKEDWQEMEATWAETAFSTSKERSRRVDYLFNVHTAVRTGNFSLITEPPFNNKETFQKINQSVKVAEGSSNLDYQYGHYILAPIALIGIDGLLLTYAPQTSIEKILKEVHLSNNRNFFDALKDVLPAQEYERSLRFVSGLETVPREIIDRAVMYYER
ncbi:hypothetical protein EPO56_03235 [Patescibacteria group bacterium]|nr:MAG: hypothetical protein EPO56_03235 [Patescibacteria group bacterium]